MTTLLLLLSILIPPPQVHTLYQASWYGNESCVHKSCLMANGHKFKEDKVSCASRKYYGELLILTYQGQSIICPVTDKISKNFDDRVDLSKKAFQMLIGELDKGLATIQISNAEGYNH